jgi:drug/metabolite transporter (DMT)-like permease
MFGVGDLLAGVGGRRDRSPDSPVGIALTASAVGAVLSGLYLLVLSNDRFTGDDVYWAVAAAVFMSAGRPLLYKGVAIGPIVVFAPVFALVALVVPALLGLAVGQSLSLLEVLAVVVAVPAVVLMSSEKRLPELDDLRSSSVVANAVLTGALIGLAGLFLSFVSEGAGAAPAFVIALAGLLVIPVVGRAIGLSVRVSSTTTTFGFMVGCTSILGFVLASITYQRGNAAIGSALIGLSPGVTIALAWKFLHERLWPLQIAGTALGALTILLFALAS